VIEIKKLTRKEYSEKPEKIEQIKYRRRKLKYLFLLLNF